MTENQPRTRVWLLPCIALLAAMAGCAHRCANRLADNGMQQLSLLMPQEIQIVEAFTKFAALDKSDKVDGIELRLRPLDSFGDPIKIAGIVRAELYHRLPASGKREGMRVCPPWKISLSTEQDERKYWNPLTAMYEIPLKLPGGQPPDGQYVVDVIYTTPLDCRLFDQCELNMPPSG